MGDADREIVGRLALVEKAVLEYPDGKSAFLLA
jgi:hypothetical protein